jgi:hypothetical protein
MTGGGMDRRMGKGISRWIGSWPVYRQRFGTFEAGVASTRDPKYVVVPQRERLEADRG